jgi:hypothetical protein
MPVCSPKRSSKPRRPRSSPAETRPDRLATVVTGSDKALIGFKRSKPRALPHLLSEGGLTSFLMRRRQRDDFADQGLALRRGGGDRDDLDVVAEGPQPIGRGAEQLRPSAVPGDQQDRSLLCRIGGWAWEPRSSAAPGGSARQRDAGRGQGQDDHGEDQ